MEFDLHTHTLQGSACSRMDVRELIQTARERGLAGVCVTDHDFQWEPAELAELGKAEGLQVYAGVELSTPLGEVLIYGVHVPLVNLRDDPEHLHRVVKARGGVMVAAHPFRSDFSLTTVLTRDECGYGPMDISLLCARPIFTYVDTIEVYNGRSSNPEVNIAFQTAELLGIKGTGGSDAHSALGVGRCVTEFRIPVRGEQDLLRELLTGNFVARRRV